ncbi:hypothetical protein [Tumebacillus lipolyticus]|uniref:Uncharacterized protein n=1 Tax=Tumebacillus lipolyticus TaxID=1280370 RepID=A0ABW4ZXD7_9BACL
MARLFEVVISILLGLFSSLLLTGDMSQTINGAIFWMLVFILFRLPGKKKQNS